MRSRSRLFSTIAAAMMTAVLASTAACGNSSDSGNGTTQAVGASSTPPGSSTQIAGSSGQASDTEGSTGSSGAVGSSSAASGNPTTGPMETVALATLAPSSLLWLHAIADKQGLYAQHSVEVKTIQIQSSSALVQAVASGSANAGVSLGDNVITAVDKGAPIVMTGAMLQKAALRLYGSPGVKSIADLKGARVTAGAVSGGTADLLLYQLMQSGLAKSDVQLLALTNSKDRVVALKNGQVKGSLLIPPYDTLAEQDGDTMLGWYDKAYIETPLIVNSSWAKDNKRAAQGLTQALADAAKWIYDPANAAAAQTILKDYTKVSADAAKNAYKFMVTDGKVLSPDLAVQDDGLQNIVDISAAVDGKTAAQLDISKYYDASYLTGNGS